MRQFEYVIAGAGAAGLTLAYMLMGGNNTKKPTLIIDKASKNSNDRTWCFWEEGDNLLESIVFKSWEQARFKSDNFEQLFPIGPYRYKMIRAIDFYDFMRSELASHKEITWIQEDIRHISPEGIVSTDNGDYQGKLVFDSTKSLPDFAESKRHTNLLQHFKGYFLETTSPIFDPAAFTYMDFTIPQHGDFRFGYVLPFSPTNALVEYTIFSRELLEEQAYTEGLNAYIRENLKIDNFKVSEEEFGVIPMTDFPFQFKVSDQVFRIGISGGFAKPSTGYTFLRSQHLLAKMVANIEHGLAVDKDLPYTSKRFKKYDSTLLKVLEKSDNKGKQAFTEMFRKNGMQKMFRFLDEETSLSEELAIMSSTPLLTFGKAFFQSITKS